jgi:hypothetical protein
MSPELKEAGVAILNSFIGELGSAWTGASPEAKKLAEEAAFDAARIAAMGLLDPQAAKTEKAIVDATLYNLKVALGLTVQTTFWNAAVKALEVAAPILFKVLLTVLA